MAAALRKTVRTLIGRRLTALYVTCSTVVRLLIRELARMRILIRCRQRCSNDPEFILGELRIWGHIVDKGLRAENWETNHGGAPYQELCRQLERLKDSALVADPSYQWALDIKKEYEATQAQGCRNGHGTTSPSTGIEKNDLLNLIKNRRSIRSFENRPIAKEILEELADVVSWSATSCNRQPTKLFITQNPEKVALCMRQCAGATCFGETSPCFAAVCADTRPYILQDRNLPFIDASLGLQNMLLLSHVHGIGVTLLNWMHHTPEEDAILRRTLKIPEHYLVVTNLIMGYTDKSIPAPGRKAGSLAYVLVD